MSENKFLAKMRGEKAPKSLVEVKNDKFSTPFVGLPKSTSVSDGFDNEAGHSIVVAKSAQNWALQKSGIELLADAESADYTGQVSIAGHGMWVNSLYTFPLSEEPSNPVVAIINPCAKWVLNFVGKDLFSQNDTIGFTLVVKVGATHISNIDCEVKRQAGFFCKKFVIDFSESEQELIKVNGGDTLTVQLVCNDDTASAVYYTGISVLSLLQRKVDGDVVAGDTKTFGDLVEDVYNIKRDIDNRFFGVYKFKGTVPTYTALPQQNNVIGDTYNVDDTGSNYTWDGTAWDKLSETVDLSNYATKDYVEEKIAGFEALPDQTGNVGKFLMTDGSAPKWVGYFGTTGGASGTSLVLDLAGVMTVDYTAKSLVAIAPQANSSGLWSVNILGGSCSTNAISIGFGSSATKEYAVGINGQATGAWSIALGYLSTASAYGAVQLGVGTNSTKNTLQFKDYKVVDADGTIPADRMSATAGTAGQVLTKTDTGMEWQEASGGAKITIIRYDE